MSHPLTDTTTRFSNRVENYVRYRPSYPQAVVQHLIAAFSLNRRSAIADMGSGTGIFTELLLGNELPVIAVEPNQAMRQAADARLHARAGYSSVDGCAEHSTLQAHSIDLITVAQAFHWFRQTEAKLEFKRILKPQGGIALVWNRRDSGSAFLADYEAFLVEALPEYNEVKHTRLSDQEICAFLGTDAKVSSYDYRQEFDFDGLCGRFLSSSYAPADGDAAFTDVMDSLRTLFDQHADNERIVFSYKTQVYTGRG